MAENPQLFGNGMPVPFYGEMFVLARDGIEFHVDKIPSYVSSHLLISRCRERFWFPGGDLGINGLGLGC